MVYSYKHVPMWFNYDGEADVVYIHFEEHPTSNHSDLREDGVILDYHDERLVGVTILAASRRKARKNPRRSKPATE